MSGVSGDFARMNLLLRLISPQRIEELKRSLVPNLAEEAITQIRLGFEQGRAPDGKPWAPLKRKRKRDARGSKGIPLNDSGRLKNSWTKEIRANGFTWTSNVTYAPPHQYGAKFSGRANAHARGGKFISKSAAGKRQTGATRVSFSRGWTLPARPMIPNGGKIPPIWRAAFDRVIRRTLAGYGIGG